MSFSTKSHSIWLSRPWVSHWGSADSEAVASVVQMMALLWGQGFLHNPSTVSLISYIAVSLYQDCNLRLVMIYPCSRSAPHHIRTRSSLHVENVDRGRYTWGAYRDRLLCCFSGPEEYCTIMHVGCNLFFDMLKLATCLLEASTVVRDCVTHSASAALWSYGFPRLCHFWSNIKPGITVEKFVASAVHRK